MLIVSTFGEIGCMGTGLLVTAVVQSAKEGGADGDKDLDTVLAAGVVVEMICLDSFNGV